MLDTHQRAQCNFSVKVAIFCQYIATKHLKLHKKVDLCREPPSSLSECEANGVNRKGEIKRSG
mgnify:CR=1 FL=1